MFVVFMLALSQDCILIMYLLCFSLASLMYIDALMFMLMQCTYMTGKHLIFSPFAPDLASLSFLLSFSQLQTIFWSLFCRFVMMTNNKKSELKILESSENLPRWHAVLTALTVARWWSTGRAETSRLCGVRQALLVLVRLELSWLFGLRSLLPPSPFGF